MRARVPLDVDLEDRLLYGLTPARLMYVVLALLAGFALWSAHWMPGFVRGPLAAVVVAGGGVAAWGRWRGRAADAWLVDLVRFVGATQRIHWGRRA
ncbi:MAG TPA: hypothetical protein VFL29_10185 [Candidatus Dormibacteraeota bacterium]|nr:hypothetical protein [Candidatus Dormibacteraeota bacterium]